MPIDFGFFDFLDADFFFVVLSPVAAAVVLLLAVDFGVTGDGCCEVSLDVESARDDSDLTSFFDDFTATFFGCLVNFGVDFFFFGFEGGLLLLLPPLLLLFLFRPGCLHLPRFAECLCRPSQCRLYHFSVDLRHRHGSHQAH